MTEGITFVGFDAHKASISVAMLLPNAVTPVEWQLPNEASSVRRMVRKIEREAPGEVHTCYEAGPCGYALQRQITESSGSGSALFVSNIPWTRPYSTATCLRSTTSGTV